jgi:Repeat of unknown function (DUF5907)
MKYINCFLVLLTFFIGFQSMAQSVVTNRNGREITVNSPASTSAQGQVQLAGDLAGTADAPTVPALTNKLEGTGTLNYVPKFSASKTLTNSLIFDNGTNVGVGTTSPGNKFEITQGTAGNSGLRFTNLNSASTATTSLSKVLALNSTGDVILTNVPGTQNIVDFSTATPTSSGVVFTPNTPADESVLYQSAVDNSMWTYNGTAYVTYTAPASTAWFTSGTTNDAGSSKTSNIYRTGNVGIGISTPSSPLDVQTSAVSSFVSIAKFLAPSNLTAGNSSQLNFGVSASTGNSADWRYVYQGNGAASNRVDFGMSGSAAPMLSYLNSGNVGIGTTGPATKLHIQGIQATLGANANASMLRMSRPTWSGFKFGSAAQFNLGTYDDGVNPVHSKSRLDLALTNINDETTFTNVMTWLGSGNVGIKNTAPSASLVVQGATGTGVLKLIAPSVASGDNWWMGFGHGTTSTDANDRARIGVDIVAGGAGRLFFTTGPTGTQTRAMFIDESQRVGIGTNAPVSRLEVNGASTNTTAFNAAAGTSIDFTRSNLAYTTASAGAFTLTGIKDGGTYTLSVQGATAGTASFTATGFTFRNVNNGITTASRHTLYTFIVMGTNVYFYMVTGI